MVARPFVTQGFVDENHVWGLSQGEDLPRGGDTDEQLTAGGEEFPGHQRREGQVALNRCTVAVLE